MDSIATVQDGDCLVVMPQNTLPMAKHRKRIHEGKKGEQDEDAPLSDAQLWCKQKLQEEKGRVRTSKFNALPGQLQVSHKRQSLWGSKGNEEVEPPRSLEEEIYKPTYMHDANMSDENILSALRKGESRRKSLAFIGNVVSKITKGKQQQNFHADEGFEFAGMCTNVSAINVVTDVNLRMFLTSFRGKRERRRTRSSAESDGYLRGC